MTIDPPLALVKKIKPAALLSEGATAFSNLNLADLWVNKHAHDWRYVAADGTWRHWVGDGWQVDKIQARLLWRVALLGCLSSRPA